MEADVLLGLQWGDEGKGKIVDVLTPEYDIIARFQGGPNAGHTLEFNEIKHVLHTIPSGIFREGAVNVIGNGVVIDPVTLAIEIDALEELDVDVNERLRVSKKAHIILPTHRLLDAASERAKGTSKIGSTLKGIGPTYMDKTGRNGLRVGDVVSGHFDKKYKALKNKHLELLSNFDYPTDDLSAMEDVFFESIDSLRELPLIDSEHYINRALNQNKKILAEGAQGSLLDIDFGSYPFVTSSNTVCAGACTGLGLAPNKIGDVYGIFKSYCTRVGSGPFPTELFDEDGRKLATKGHEFGATTGRPRRCGWLDLPALKYAVMLNGVTKLIMTKADVLSTFKEFKVCTSYQFKGEEIDYFPFDVTEDELKPVWKSFPGWNKDLSGCKSVQDLPSNLLHYIEFLEKELNVPITVVSIGPKRDQTLTK